VSGTPGDPSFPIGVLAIFFHGIYEADKFDLAFGGYVVFNEEQGSSS
jgi:hypothetical protein